MAGTALSDAPPTVGRVTIRVALHHATTYRFDHPVEVHPHVVRLRPAPHCRTPITAYSLSVEPGNHFINWQQDPFGNYLARLVFPEQADELRITVDLVADMTVINPFDFFVEEYAENFGFAYPDDLARDLQPYLHRVGAEPASADGADAVDTWIAERLTAFAQTRPRIVDFLVGVNRAVQHAVAYTTRLEPGVQTPGETLAKAIGSCRDSGWLLVSVLRRFGLAARFVSGYLVQLKSDTVPLDGPAGPEADFTDLHAWAEVFIPGAGWVGLDATSGLLAGEGHIPLSCTPEPASAAPISGSTGVVGVTFDFENSVRRIHEDARVTLPYTDAAWVDILALGAAVDARLDAGDVRLTMGGEPTFVSASDTSTPQWETDADGPEKRVLAGRLGLLLRERWAPGGIVHHGQGKWYPGEELPRWAMQLTWRADGVPLWSDAALLDDPWSPSDLDADAAARASERLARALASRLGVARDLVVPAFEDVLAQTLAEAQQPYGERPDDPDPTGPLAGTPQGRAELADAADAAATDPAGWIIPLFVDPDREGWATARWRPRRRTVFLLPGTSPLGLRLPLASIAWGEPPEITRNNTGDAAAPLPAPAPAPTVATKPARELDIDVAPRTAVTVEQRDGHLFVFLPPLDRADDGVALLAAVEAAASEVGVPVVLEGYPLPHDDRLRSLSVTPDPGVIEVNVQPTSSFAELVELTTTLYSDARRAGLSTEKFDLDGTHTGTGGGNHITLGGETAKDSPLLRRPDVLRSMLTYWQQHPGLSYVFSGRFIGPTSQAPRVDEGRHETLYELETAFAELDALASDPAIEHDLDKAIKADWRTDETPEERVERQRHSQPWLVDRLLRHLLTDVTGNTHRAEFCVDKLYNADRRGGQSGLLEMRSFEMPPHERMGLTQALLVRTLLARFWEAPWASPLTRWGTRLHDRFLLPAFAAADLRAVIAETNAHLASWPGAPAIDESWFEPFLEFRFPRLGEVDVDVVHLELRQAIEPWHVLGEEVGLGGTARYVDSSVERVQVAATGLVEGRHVVTCNGVPMPMVPSGAGRVGGVRFRAWAPPSALHATIGVHSPLDFDLVDVASGESLGGFTYHVVHPGGRAYDTYPVNAVEAESRRASRFEPNRTRGHVDLGARPGGFFGAEAPEFPCTLDLRRHDRGHP
jgi:uncharacterized protein (DUF2126 family)/transglutaminase-like putative cysteine protease